MKRLLCALIGHHTWPEMYSDAAGDWRDPDPFECLRCGMEHRERPYGLRPLWRRLLPVGFARDRWSLRLRLGWLAVASVRLNLILRDKYAGGWYSRVELVASLWRAEAGVRLGGFWPGEEDHERSLFGAWATFDTEGGAALICRLRGHDPWESNGWSSCNRCQVTLSRPEEAARAA